MVATVLPRVARPPAADELTLADADCVRLMLRGDSVIDWHRLSFPDHAEVDRFLRLNEFDPESDVEMDAPRGHPRRRRRLPRARVRDGDPR